MRKLLCVVALCALWSLSAAARAPLTLACEDGNKTITLSGLTAAQKVMGSFPSCTINVYLPGTTTLATIYADNVGTPKANPFTALSTGWFTFYADDGCYDVRRSGTIPTPFTQPFCIFDSTGGGGGGGGYDTIQNEGVNLTQQTTLNFVGATVNCVNDGPGSRTTCTFIAGSGQYNQTIQDEGVALTQQPILNFTGSGVTCVNDGAGTRTTCNIPGGGSSSDAWIDGGNSFASSTPSIGNINNKSMAFLTNNIERFRLTNAGLLSLGLNSTGIGITNTGSTGRIAWPKAYLEENTNVHRQSIDIGDGATAAYSSTINNRPIVPSSVTVYINNVSQGTDNGAGVLTGAGISAGTIDYTTGAISVTFTGNVPDGEYVDVGFTVSGNLIAGTTNTNAFTVIPNALKIDNSKGLGALFTTTQYNLFTTQHITPITEAPIGTVAVQADDDATNPIGDKKLRQYDSAGNVRTFCYEDSDFGTCSPTDPNSLLVGDPRILGGLVGGKVSSATTWDDAPFDRDFFMMPQAVLLGTPVLCSLSANTSLLRQVWWAMNTPNNAGPNTPPSSNTNNTFYIHPNASAGCYTGQRRFDYYPKFGIARINVGAAGVGTGNTIDNWVGPIHGVRSSPLVAQPVDIGGTLAGGQTGFTVHAGVFTLTENQMGAPIPVDGTFGNFCLYLSVAQPGTGTLVFVARKNGTTDVATMLTVAAGAVAGRYCGNTTAAYTEGDWYTIKVTNNAATTSGTVHTFTWDFTPTDDAYNAMVPFPYINGGSLAASTDNYFNSIVNSAITTTENTHRMPAGRPFTLKSLYCYNLTAATNPVTVTIVKNGTPSAVTFSYPAATTGVQGIDGQNLTFLATDFYSLNAASGASTQAAAFNCAMGIL